MATPIEISFQNLNAGYCFTTPQQFAQDIAERFTGDLVSGSSLWTLGKSTPSHENQDRPWFRLNPDGSSDRLYYYWNGQWVAKHPVPALSSDRRIWTSTAASIATYDGGDSNAATFTSGPMWEVDSEFAARFPVGVGTTPNGTVIEISGGFRTGGEDEHILTILEMPIHTHGATNVLGGREDNTSGEYSVYSQSGPAGGDKPHNNLPPYTGVYFIKRTQRIFYVAN